MQDGSSSSWATARWIAAAGRDHVSLKDIRRDALGETLNGSATLDLLDVLEKAGWLRKIEKASSSAGGRCAITTGAGP
jgi:hypothetical protein